MRVNQSVLLVANLLPWKGLEALICCDRRVKLIQLDVNSTNETHRGANGVLVRITPLTGAAAFRIEFYWNDVPKIGDDAFAVRYMQSSASRVFVRNFDNMPTRWALFDDESNELISNVLVNEDVLDSKNRVEFVIVNES